ncbi:MAG: nitroreductase family protein [Aestuariivita sp.]|nr:nitroreductase family protein [Aestuariivita sp.]
MRSKNDLIYQALPLPHRNYMTDEDMNKHAKAFFQKMKQRHSVRHYSSQTVSRDVIMNCIRAAGTAPSGANHQPWHFVAISESNLKAQIREQAEAEEQRFYAGGAGDEWIKALEPIGTNAQKPHLTIAPWLIVVFAQRWGEFDDGTRYKNYYVPESVNISIGILLTALHYAGLCTLTHTPNPMKFLNSILYRPESEKATMIIAVGHPATDATVPAMAKWKKPTETISTFFE